MIRQALLSWYHKDELAPFARRLLEHGAAILATGGTADHLEQNGIACRRLETLTQFADLVGGRVKSLHPAVFAAVLARRDNPAQLADLRRLGIDPIDLVSIDPYPFEQLDDPRSMPSDELVEWIDIGGPSLLRAAAKNHRYVWAAIGPAAAHRVLEWAAGSDSDEELLRRRRQCAAEVFACLSRADAAIAAALNVTPDAAPAIRWPDATAAVPLRYGENPHQLAWFLSLSSSQGPGDFEPDLHDWSFNNLLDADAAAALCADVAASQPQSPGLCVAAVVKHNAPCGVGWGASPEAAWERAYLGDPQAAMGGVAAFNHPVTPQLAEAVMHSLDRWGRAAGAGAFFLDVWTSPDFEPNAVEIIRRAKPWGERVKLRRLDVSKAALSSHGVRAVRGGMIVQTHPPENFDNWKSVGRRAAGKEELDLLRAAWAVCAHARSNAVCLVAPGRLIGCGAGQTSRVRACRLAVETARECRHLPAPPPVVAASDGFFPYPDSIDILADAGVTDIVQPGGSKNDERIIEACDRRGLTLVLTGRRAFRH